MSKTALAIEQIKDQYGNLMQLWGVYRIQNTWDASVPMVKKCSKRTLLCTCESVHAAQKHLDKYK